jgi:nicotinamide riboside kinase
MMALRPGHIMAIVGAESTGKTQLARELLALLQARGLDAVTVGEALREFCDHHGRTPMAHEQADIAAEQTRRIQQAAQTHTLVLADTTALMTAVYSELIFGDQSLYPQAAEDHRQATMTLLTAVDLPWVADGVQRDGPHVRLPVDHLLRQSLMQSGVPYAVVGGLGPARVAHALSVVDHVLDEPQRRIRAASSPRWRWFCNHCGDGECEQHSRLAGT